VAGVGGRAGGAALSGGTPVDLPALLAGPVLPAAQGLLGCRLAAGGVTVRLTEVEAYEGVGADEASHAHRGWSVRNQVMFGPPGRLYVYFTYGMHWCLNIVCGPEGVASAVLLRAGEVLGGLEEARKRRPTARVDHDLARGPARLALALGLDGTANGADLLDPSARVTLARPLVAPAPALVRAGPRVGVGGAADRPWRFWLDGEPTVSPYRRRVRRSGRG
jgi:DNA-3-methyladenine glycosylase